MSQADQDKFVINILKNKQNGFFLEIGSHHPININNTYKLEKEYGWTGLMVEYEPSYENLYKTHRTSNYIIQDATTINYLELFQKYNFPKNMDYLQIDLEVENRSTLTTLEVLEKQLFSEYKFATVTFEHDFYRGDYFETRKKSREIFTRYGYTLIFPDAGHPNFPFEDWYVHTDLVVFDRFDTARHITNSITNGIFVEIGTHEGFFSDRLMEANPTATLYCIDPYVKYEEYKDGINFITGDELFNKTVQELKSKYGDRVIFIREFSSNAINLIPDNIDFLYIDGNHTYKYVYDDLKNYFDKVKSGGYIMGDDAVDTDESKRDENGDVFIEWSPGCYGNYGVIKAFNDFIKNKGISGTVIRDQYLIKK
jgi:hypothetical protein